MNELTLGGYILLLSGNSQYKEVTSKIAKKKCIVNRHDNISDIKKSLSPIVLQKYSIY